MEGFLEHVNGVFDYMTSQTFAAAAANTLKLTLLAQLLGVALGFLLALGKMSKWSVLNSAANGYIWFFRGIPVLVQLIFVFNALPQFGIRLSGFECALIALALNEAAYMAEIIRSGLSAVSKGQKRAAHVLGMNNWQTMRHVVLPQAVRLIVPPTGNQFIGMLKTSAMASVVGYMDLLLTAQQAASATFNYVDTLIAAVIYYLVFTALFTLLQGYIERKMDVVKASERKQKLLIAKSGISGESRSAA
ncbi:polar amino acid ABC transporter permease [Paenibacillus oryzae]|uniref:Polar amino acid ABC transporter permease n=1 Tax=Paenibacillus oryzae TaxID=1844972 RepID=A0A1A5YFI8_9BACL|nr:amino acid ABC transporter permease [Paenibacillus oryzae]OBR64359.1 polar amino acid ABC transporter permease [Paenibacillus oryzae]